MESGKPKELHSEFIDPIGTIMIVDDKPAYSYALVEILRIDGFDVHWSVSATQALADIDDVSPDMLLIDIVMPGDSGLTLIHKLRSQPAWAEVPIIVVSASTLPEDQAAALKAGADAFLAKPFSRQELRSAIWPFIPAIAPILFLPTDIRSAA